MAPRIEPTESAIDELQPLKLECKCDPCLESVQQGGLIDSNHVYRSVYSKSDYEAVAEETISNEEWNQFKEDLRTQEILVHRSHKIW